MKNAATQSKFLVREQHVQVRHHQQAIMQRGLEERQAALQENWTYPVAVEGLTKFDRLGDDQTIALPIVGGNHIQISAQVTWQEVRECLALQPHIECRSHVVPI